MFTSHEQASRNTAMLGAFESIVVDQTKAFLLSVGREFPDLNKIAQKIKDIPSIRKNISLIVLITYTRIYNKRPQGLELSAGGTVDELANLKILIQSVAAGAAGGGAYGGEVAYGETTNGRADPALDISAEAILTSSSRADAALHLHKLVKLLDQVRIVCLCTLSFKPQVGKVDICTVGWVLCVRAVASLFSKTLEATLPLVT